MVVEVEVPAHWVQQLGPAQRLGGQNERPIYDGVIYACTAFDILTVGIAVYSLGQIGFNRILYFEIGKQVFSQRKSRNQNPSMVRRVESSVDHAWHTT